ncbi:MAG: glutathione S-transferase C-terminal domain-containing protein [Carboxylicivirga sp.]|jgi:glutathione S-transferase|nr:glutathione S-transferase C-terminal domain-containing protein [Carboxylicivirga sp.]
MIEIISFKICPCYQRITALLEAIHVPYQSKFLELNSVPRWFYDLSPEMEPAIQTDMGEYIAGLDNAIQHLEKYYCDLFFMASFKCGEKATDLNDLANEQYINQCNTQRSPDLKSLQENGQTFYDALSIMEKELGDKRFFKGEQLSEIDIAWLPILHRTHIVQQKTDFDFLEDFPKVKKWQDKLMATGIPDKSVPEDFSEVFDEFYLNESSYLGQLYRHKTAIK